MTAPPSGVTLAIRRAWAFEAQRRGLRPAAAYWRWVCLERGHVVYFLKSDWRVKLTEQRQSEVHEPTSDP